ncbi:acyl-CoA dehydrogenase family protein [Diaphorobacter aerolatus]|uniref:hypothetical protein n=1 Tax=Diaphorobacter aerolatus TaxID=1288495 RepID=UPI001D02EDB0|nr:hypothetical protein [Diaphorobacter aerolatus]
MHAPSIDGDSALAATDVAARRKSQSLFCGAIAQTPRLPDPGRGRTLDRWRALAQLGAVDLGAAKLAEAHWDAQSVLSELDYVPGHAEGAWAVWAADHPVAPLTLSTKTQASARLNGDKHWCSGADVVRHALVTCRGAQQEVWLAHVDMRSVGLSQDASTWRGLGMRSVATPRLSFDDVPVVALLGGAGPISSGPVSGMAARALRPAGGVGRAPSQSDCERCSTPTIPMPARIWAPSMPVCVRFARCWSRSHGASTRVRTIRIWSKSWRCAAARGAWPAT